MNIQFNKLGITAELFPAIAGKDVEHMYPAEDITRHGLNAFGCLESYKRIIRKYYHSRAVALFEDDLILVDDFNEHLEGFLEAVPKDWDMLYLAGAHTDQDGYRPVRICKNVYKVISAFGVHGVIINKRIYDRIIVMYDRFPAPFDALLRDLQKGMNVYCINPHICYNYPTHSTVQNQFMLHHYPSPMFYEK
jgi:GR25 family glycosyltransferase involved in LPS biosynthesis